MTQPTRIQRRRVKGWRLPPNAVIVSRPTIWGNPFRLGSAHPVHGSPMTREEGVELYRQWWAGTFATTCFPGPPVDRIAELRGKDLACFCPVGSACHGDVLLELANR